MTWITINLPYRTEPNHPLYLEVTRLAEEYQTWEDTEADRRFGPLITLYWSSEKFREVRDRCPDLDDPANWQSLMTHDDPDVRILATRRQRLALRRDFGGSSEAIERQAPVWEARKREESGQFVNHPMNRPGVVIEVCDSDGARRRLMIEHGTSQDLKPGDVVTRYMDLDSTAWTVTEERVRMLRWAQAMFENQPGDTAKRNRVIAAEMVAEAGTH